MKLGERNKEKNGKMFEKEEIKKEQYIKKDNEWGWEKNTCTSCHCFFSCLIRGLGEVLPDSYTFV